MTCTGCKLPLMIGVDNVVGDATGNYHSACFASRPLPGSIQYLEAKLTARLDDFLARFEVDRDSAANIDRLTAQVQDLQRQLEGTKRDRDRVIMDRNREITALQEQNAAYLANLQDYWVSAGSVVGDAGREWKEEQRRRGDLAEFRLYEERQAHAATRTNLELRSEWAADAEKRCDEARAALAKLQADHEGLQARNAAVYEDKLRKAEEENARLREEQAAQWQRMNASIGAERGRGDDYKAALGRANDRVAELEAQIAAK